MTARWLDLTPAQYHAAVPPGEVPPLSHSLAVELLNRTPLHARRKWLARGPSTPHSEEAAEKRRRLEWGTLVHSELLGGVDDRIVIACNDTGLTQEPFTDWRTKAAQAARKRIYEDGRIPVLEKQIRDARVFADKVRGKLRDVGIDLEPNEQRFNEQAIMWGEDGTPCRAMFDHVDLRKGLVLDIKTAENAHPERLKRSVIDFGYDVQAAAYTSALEHLDARLAGRVRFALVVCEAHTAEVVIVELGGDFLHLGRQRWARAVRTWARCCASNTWPGYPRSVRLECPEWAIAAEMRAAHDDNDLAVHAEPRGADDAADPPEGDEDDGSEEACF
jgi:hypothetical protein